MDAAIIEKEALRLSEAERALLADRLLLSLSKVSEELKNAWVSEANDRMSAFRNGEIEAVDGPVAMADLRARFVG
ncbi:MAG: addiction module protein [Verrucomicrobiales bacterium]